MLGSTLRWPSLLLGPSADAIEALAAALLFGDVSGISVVSSEAAAAAAASSALGQTYSVVSGEVAGAATAAEVLGQPCDVQSSETAGAATVAESVLLAHEVASAEAAGAATAAEVLYQVASVVSALTAGVAGESIVLNQPTGSRPTMQRLQLTATVTGSDGTVSRLKDGHYRYTYAWSCASGNWAAFDLGTDAARSQVLVCLSNESSGAGDIDDAGLANVTLRTSSDSTNGTDGTWTSYTITGSPYIYAAKSLPFTDCRWLRLEVGDGVTAIDEADIWNCSAGADAYCFLGDSITNRGTKRHDAVQPSMQSIVNSRISEYPMQIGAGIIGIGAATLDANIASYLSAWPMVKWWLIGIGTNDAFAGAAGISAFTTRLTSIVNQIRAAGGEAIIARIPWTSLASYGGGTYGADNTYLYNQAIDSVRTALGLRPGPDFYAYVYENQTVWYNPAEGGDGVHPGTTGVKMWNEQWANVVDDLYFLVDNYVASNEYGASGTTSEMLAQYPHVATVEMASAGTEAATLQQPNTVVSGEFAGISIEASTLGQPTAIGTDQLAAGAVAASLLTQYSLVGSVTTGATAVEESTLTVLHAIASMSVADPAIEICQIVTAIRVLSETAAASANEATTLEATSYIWSEWHAGKAAESCELVYLIRVENTVVAQPALVSCTLSTVPVAPRVITGGMSRRFVGIITAGGGERT